MSGKRPVGPARDWTLAQLDNLSTITQADIERAQEAWKQDSDATYRDLLDALPDEKAAGHADA